MRKPQKKSKEKLVKMCHQSCPLVLVFCTKLYTILAVSKSSIALAGINLTRSLPQDVYIRRQNDHPGGQGRIYTSHLNFVSTHLSKPGHRCGCCCMSPRCLLRQFVDRCLLFWAFFIEKTVLLCFARFLSKWRETALWLFPDATSWYELYV